MTICDSETDEQFDKICEIIYTWWKSLFPYYGDKNSR